MVAVIIPAASALLFTIFSSVSASGGAPAQTFSLTSTTTSIISGGYLNISWTNAKIGSADDWIVFSNSKAGAAPSNSSYFSDCWQYVYGDTVQTGTNSTASGTVSIKAPAIPGTFTAWYCLNNNFTCTEGPTVTTTTPQISCRAAGTTASNIKNVVIVISENHSFDSYFGNYCTAPAGTQPTCNVGHSCCAAYTPIAGVSPYALNDTQNLAYDPDHTFAAENCEIDGGHMDKFIGSGNCKGSDNRNYAVASGQNGSALGYWSLASQYAMADRFFQSFPGQSSENDMYFARGAFVFQDNNVVPPSNICELNLLLGAKIGTFNDPTIADLLGLCNVGFTFYAQGMDVPPASLHCYPDYYDPSDDPFQYYPSLTNSSKASTFFKDFSHFATDVANNALPPVTYIKPLGLNSEHPGYGSITAGEEFNANIIDTILNSTTYAESTLIILVPDESGGFRDSAAPPARSVIDSKPYGPRTPIIAVGYPANQGGYISHVQMEPASIIRFIEENFLAGGYGQLKTRDGVVNGLGSLLNGTRTGYMFG